MKKRFSKKNTSASTIPITQTRSLRRERVKESWEWKQERKKIFDVYPHALGRILMEGDLFKNPEMEETYVPPGSLNL